MSSVMRISIAITVVVLSLAGCGLKQQYGGIVADLRVTGSEHVVVGAVDTRPYVVNGEKAPSYVGVMRAAVGIPYDVHTDDKKPLAREVAEAVCRSLVPRGFRCTAEVYPPAGADAGLAQTMSRQTSTKGLLFRVNEWQVDTYVLTNLRYDIQLAVRDRDGRTLATSTSTGQDSLGSVGAGLWAPAAVANEETPKALKRMLETLLNDPGVTSAFTK